MDENSWLLDLDSLSAVDECGFNLGAVLSYARADKNQRAVVKRPTRGWNHTLLLCVKNVNQKAVIHYYLTKEKENRWRNSDFFATNCGYFFLTKK